MSPTTVCLLLSSNSYIYASPLERGQWSSSGVGATASSSLARTNHYSHLTRHVFPFDGIQEAHLVVCRDLLRVTICNHRHVVTSETYVGAVIRGMLNPVCNESCRVSLYLRPSLMKGTLTV